MSSHTVRRLGKEANHVLVNNKGYIPVYVVPMTSIVYRSDAMEWLSGGAREQLFAFLHSKGLVAKTLHEAHRQGIMLTGWLESVHRYVTKECDISLGIDKDSNMTLFLDPSVDGNECFAVDSRFNKHV